MSNKFKVGDVVRCLVNSASSRGSVMQGKHYLVAEVAGGSIHIPDLGWFPYTLFTLANEDQTVPDELIEALKEWEYDHQSFGWHKAVCLASYLRDKGLVE